LNYKGDNMKSILFLQALIIFALLTSCSLNNNTASTSNINSNQPGKTSINNEYETPPKVIKHLPQIYPEFVKRMGIEGDVLLNVEVLSDGTVGDVEVMKSLMSGRGGLDEAAVNAVKQWKFIPAEYNGEPVSVRITIPVTFTLD